MLSLMQLKKVLSRCFKNSGQSCNAPTRMLVEKSIYSEAIERVKKYTSEIKVGDPNKDGIILVQ